MLCDEARRVLLDFGWDGSERSRAGDVLAHLDRCEECSAAADDFDRVSSALEPEPGEEAEPQGGWSAFEERLVARTERSRLRSWLVPVGVAASIFLAAAVGWEIRRRTTLLPIRNPGVSAAEKPLTKTEIAEHTKAFKKIAEVFEGKVGWISLSDGGADMGVSSSEPGTGGKLLLLRLTMVSDDGIVSRADIAVVPGQSAETVVMLDDKRRLRYSIGTANADKGRLSVRVVIEATQGRAGPLASLGTTLAPGKGRTFSAGRLVTLEGSYELNVGVAWARL